MTGIKNLQARIVRKEAELGDASDSAKKSCDLCSGPDQINTSLEALVHLSEPGGGGDSEE